MKSKNATLRAVEIAAFALAEGTACRRRKAVQGVLFVPQTRIRGQGARTWAESYLNIIISLNFESLFFSLEATIFFT